MESVNTSINEGSSLDSILSNRVISNIDINTNIESNQSLVNSYDNTQTE